MRHLLVRFHGERAGEGPLTLGQRNVLLWIRQEADVAASILARPVDLAAGVGLDDVTAALGALLSRHETLRTRYRLDDEPVQMVADSGELAIEVHESTGADDDLESRLRQRLRATPFDLATDLPIRVSVITRYGRPVHVVLAISHLAADFLSAGIMARQFTRMVTDPAARVAVPTMDAVGHQPLDRARAERSPAGLRRAETAIRYWETRLRQIPQCTYAVPGNDRGASGYRFGVIRSLAAGLSLPRIAARTGASHSVVVLAAIATILTHRTGEPRCALTSMSANRFLPGARDYVGPLAQDALVCLEVGRSTFDEAVRRAWSASLTAYRHAQYAAPALWAAHDAIGHQRGIKFARDCVFNDLGAYGEDRTADDPRDDAMEPAAALTRTTLTVTDADPQSPLLIFSLIQTRPELVLKLSAELRCVPQADIEALLGGVERLLVAASAGDVELDSVNALTGLTPVRRGPEWVRVDGCWVDLSAVQRLLDDVLGTGAGRVFAETGRLVAYVAPSTATADVNDLHRACVAALPGRPSAMAPHWYVICDGAPAAPTDPAGWRARDVLAEGSGRVECPALTAVSV